MPEAPSVLIEAYLARRAELVRFFALRLRSQDAAEDLVQDIYVRLSGIDAGAIGNPAAFLYRLGSNLMLDRLRSQQRGVRRDTEWSRLERPADGKDDAPTQEHILASRQRMRRLTAVLNGLSPQTRRVFILHKFDGLTHSQVAARLGISKSAVEKHVSAALKRLLEQDI